MNVHAPPDAAQTTDFELQPTLTGELLALRPLAASDFEALYAVAADPLIWEQHPEPTRYQRDVFMKSFFMGALASGSAFVITDKLSGAVIGSSRYYEWDPATREIAIGYTFLARSHWGGRYNGELKKLMLDHAFGWAKVVWFHIGIENWRSRKGTEKVGARHSHDDVKVLNGVEYQYSFYRIEAPQRSDGPRR